MQNAITPRMQKDTHNKGGTPSAQKVAGLQLVALLSLPGIGHQRKPSLVAGTETQCSTHETKDLLWIDHLKKDTPYRYDAKTRKSSTRLRRDRSKKNRHRSNTAPYRKPPVALRVGKEINGNPRIGKDGKRG